MPTSSEKGIRILDATTFFWCWSAHGPTDTGIFYDRSFVEGKVPVPLPGDIAIDLEAHGFFLSPYIPGEWFSHWEKNEGHSFHQHPVFKPLTELIQPIEVEQPEESAASNGDGFPPVPQKFLPRLSPEWVDFLSHYTAGGKLKKEYRGD